MKGKFLPITREEMKERGWDQVDFVYVSGDAYVDHPSFGHAIITRLLESRGYRVGIIAQPDWRKPESVQVFGEPRLGFMVSAGNMDSMVNHYSVSKRRRKTDAYTPGGEMGKRPDYACVVYGNLIRQTYKKTPIILGGIEASSAGLRCGCDILRNGRTFYYRTCRGTGCRNPGRRHHLYCRNCRKDKITGQRL